MGVTYATKQSQRRSKGQETLLCGSVQVFGESIHYQASGSAEEGPTILFIHESGGTSATWDGQLTGLAQGARCLVPDLPGHGRSEGLGYIRISEYRRAVLGFLDALAIRWPVVVAGVCLGAAVGLDLALHAPERVAGLVLAGVSEGGRAGEDCRKAAALGEAPEEFVAGLFGRAASRRMVAERLKRWRLTSPLVRAGDLSAVYAYPMTSSLGLLTRPVLLVAGEEDRTAPPWFAEALADEVTGVRAVVVQNAGCLSMLEQPAAFNKAVADFVGELNPACPIGPEDRQTGGYRRF